MNSSTLIEVRERGEQGKNAARRLRASGEVPAVVYGGGLGAFSVSVSEPVVRKLLRTGGENAIFQLKLGESERSAMIKDIQYDPRNGNLIHIDFQRIIMDQLIRVKVPIEVVGTSVAVKTEGAMLDFVTRELEIECLPADIPEVLSVDVTELHVGQHVEASDIGLPEGVTLVDDPHRMVVGATAMMIEEEEEAEDDDLLGAADQQPEVIQKGPGEQEED